MIKFYLIFILFYFNIHLLFSQTYTCENAKEHIGEKASIIGQVDTVTQSWKGNVFLNFCGHYPNQKFSAVIFARNILKFPNPKIYDKRTVELTGKIKEYQGKPEIVLNDSTQIKILK